MATAQLFHHLHAAPSAQRAMVSSVFRPEPFTWFSTPEGQALLPLPDGGFVSPNGEELLSAHEILDRIYPHDQRHTISAQDPVVVRACTIYANSLHNPAAATRGPWAPSVAPFTSALPTIEPLIAHPFWQRLEVLAAPLPLRHRRLPVAISADLLVRFSDGSDIGIGMVQAGSPDQLNPQRVAAELGAALALLIDTHSWWPQRAFVLFCSPGHTAVELIDVDVAISSWVDALDLYRFMSRSFQWEKPL
jgi:hypothetical protein